MAPELIVMLGFCLASLGVFSANPMFPIYNRPKIFRGAWGEPFFALLTFITMISTASLFVWGFMKVIWYINILIVVGSVVVFSWIYQLLPLLFSQSAIAVIVSAVGLLIIDYLIWL